MKVRSVILLSGGLDSAANLALCAAQDEPVLALTALYGQRAQEREAEAASALCAHFKIPHQRVGLPWLGSLGGNSLTDQSQALPKVARESLDDPSVTQKSAKSVWVPNRNGVLINVAASFAESLGASRVVVGFNREEAATFPDNSAEFLDLATGSLRLSTANGVEVHCYTVSMNKIEIVRTLKALPSSFPFELIWSCYSSGPEPCRTCESCQRLRRALSSVL